MTRTIYDGQSIDVVAFRELEAVQTISGEEEFLVFQSDGPKRANDRTLVNTVIKTLEDNQDIRVPNAMVWDQTEW